MQLKGAVAIVTGGTGGIGAACVDYLVDNGCKVAAWAISIERAKPRDNVMYNARDITDENRVIDAPSACKSAFGAPSLTLLPI